MESGLYSVTSWMICNRSITVEFFSLRNVNEGREKLWEKHFNASNLIFFLPAIIWFLLSWKTLIQRNVKFPCNINEPVLKYGFVYNQEGIDLQGRKSWKTLFDIGGHVVTAPKQCYAFMHCVYSYELTYMKVLQSVVLTYIGALHKVDTQIFVK